jgi:VWFA-related protein
MTAINDQYGGRMGKVFGTARAAGMITARLERAEFMMTSLARRTGGQIFSPLEDKQMENVYREVARELKNQYIITYVSKNSERDGRLRQVRVYLARPGYQARTREAYYAPRD